MVADPSPHAPVQLREYLAILRARRWTVLITASITVFAAMFVSLRMTPMYASTSKVLVKPPTSTEQLLGAAPAATLEIETEREVASSLAVAAIAADEMRSTLEAEELLDHLDVSVPTDTQVVSITYTDPNPLVAQQVAQTFADAYLAFKRREALKATDAAQESIQERITVLQRQIDRAEFTADHAKKNSAAATRAENIVSLLTGQMTLLRNDLSSLTTLDLDPGAILQPALLPQAPSSPNHVQNGGLGIFVGLALGIGFAFLRERLDDRLRGGEDLQEQLGVPTLIVIPKMLEWRDRRRPRLVTLEQPRGAATEAYKTMRTSILFNAARSDLKTLMVTSATAGEGKTTTAANLAVVLAQAGKRVILVSADLRKPRIESFFSAEDEAAAAEHGLSAILMGDATLQEAIVDTEVEGLWLLACGPIPANPAEMAQSSAMGTLLESLRVAADFTIVDTAPSLVVTDALAMAPHVDGILYVASAGSTDRQTVARARTQLEQVGGRIVGGVLNGFDTSKGSAYGSADGYHYGHRYGGEVENEPVVVR
ncbi:MAG TPA: polysaccharide biosynthesis tyrosine autokinase [Actinomycetota bacterium]|nr:polysaccharide biosynthesis tyrosine autokinase [Actinomycetota bacterium]